VKPPWPASPMRCAPPIQRGCCLCTRCVPREQEENTAPPPALFPPHPKTACATAFRPYPIRARSTPYPSVPGTEVEIFRFRSVRLAISSLLRYRWIMPRSARYTVTGLPHHVTHRGNRRQRTFFSNGDYRLYVRYLREACAATKTSVWAWCLMPNHVHLVLVPSTEGGLSAALHRSQGRYTRAINAREKWDGQLWQGRFASFVMDERYLLACARYVERNPVRAGLVERAADWPWSSARTHLGGPPDPLTDPGPLLERWPDWQSVLEAGERWRVVEAIRERERSGRPLGSRAFISDLAKAIGFPFHPRRRVRVPAQTRPFKDL
jgi:putative transposase